MTTELDPYLQIARWIGRSQNPFTNFYQVMHTGMKMEGYEDEDDNVNEDEDDEDDPYVAIIQLVQVVMSSDFQDKLWIQHPHIQTPSWENSKPEDMYEEVQAEAWSIRRLV